jgi:hypothetical protein
MTSYRDLIRACLQRSLAHLQLDRAEAAQSVGRELAFVGEHVEAVLGLTRQAVDEAHRWQHADHSADARVAIFHLVLAIARALDVELT